MHSIQTLGLAQVNLSKDVKSYASTAEVSFAEDNTFKIDSVEISTAEVNSVKISRFEVNIPEVTSRFSIPAGPVAKGSTTKVDLSVVGSIHFSKLVPYLHSLCEDVKICLFCHTMPSQYASSCCV